MNQFGLDPKLVQIRRRHVEDLERWADEAERDARNLRAEAAAIRQRWGISVTDSTDSGVDSDPSSA